MSSLDQLTQEEYSKRLLPYIKTEEPNKVIVCAQIKQIHLLLALKSFLLDKYPDHTIIYEAEVNFSSVIKNTLDLSNITFEKRVSFTNCTFKKNVNFRNCRFLSEVDFTDSEFEGKTRFHYSDFKKSVLFINTTFSDLVDFYEATFREAQQFWVTDFLSVTIFSNTNFRDQVQFLHNKISPSDTYISFEGAKFDKSLDVSRANFYSNIQFWQCKIGEPIPDKPWLYSTDNIYKKDFEELGALRRLRESYRKIKQEFKNKGNNIEYLRFKKFEMQVYAKEVELLDNNLNDKLILRYNKNSNDFGSNWIKGVCFTLKHTLYFFLAALFFMFLAGKITFNLTWCSIGETVDFP